MTDPLSSNERLDPKNMIEDSIMWSRAGYPLTAVSRYRDAAHEIARLRREVQHLEDMLTSVRPVDEARTCPVCRYRIGISQGNWRCGNCGWLGGIAKPEAVAGVTRSAAPDAADKGASCRQTDVKLPSASAAAAQHGVSPPHHDLPAEGSAPCGSDRGADETTTVTTKGD